MSEGARPARRPPLLISRWSPGEKQCAGEERGWGGARCTARRNGCDQRRPPPTNDLKIRSHWRRVRGGGSAPPLFLLRHFSSSLRSSRSKRRSVSLDNFVVTQRFRLILAIMPECGTSSPKSSPPRHPPRFWSAEWMCGVKSLLGEKERRLLKLQRMRFVPPAGLAVFIRPRWRRAFPDHPRPPPDSRSEERGRLCGRALLRAWAAIPSPFAIQSTGVVMECRVLTFHPASKGHTCKPPHATADHVNQAFKQWCALGVFCVIGFCLCPLITCKKSLLLQPWLPAGKLIGLSHQGIKMMVLWGKSTSGLQHLWALSGCS